MTQLKSQSPHVENRVHPVIKGNTHRCGLLFIYFSQLPNSTFMTQDCIKRAI